LKRRSGLVAGILVLVFPAIGVPFVVYLLAFALIMLGVARLGMGITGHAYVMKQEEKKSANAENLGATPILKHSRNAFPWELLSRP
jgi:hypothetical protein